MLTQIRLAPKQFDFEPSYLIVPSFACYTARGSPRTRNPLQDRERALGNWECWRMHGTEGKPWGRWVWIRRARAPPSGYAHPHSPDPFGCRLLSHNTSIFIMVRGPSQSGDWGADPRQSHIQQGTVANLEAEAMKKGVSGAMTGEQREPEGTQRQTLDTLRQTLHWRSAIDPRLSADISERLLGEWLPCFISEVWVITKEARRIRELLFQKRKVRPTEGRTILPAIRGASLQRL